MRAVKNERKATDAAGPHGEVVLIVRLSTLNLMGMAYT